MDRHNQPIPLVQYFNGRLKDFKDYFKKDFTKVLISGDGNRVEINYPETSSGKFVAIYGFDNIFDSLPEDISHLIISNKSKEKVSFKIPETINRFKNLTALLLQNIVSELPESIGELTKLKFVSLCGNKYLDEIPESVGNLPELLFINLKDCNPKLVIPKNITDNMLYEGNGYYCKKNIL
jgi:Leucine-rich repeat (LRR) protein